MLVTKNPHGLQEGSFYLGKLREEVCPRYCEHIENLLSVAAYKDRLPKSLMIEGIDLALAHAHADYALARYKFPVQFLITKLQEKRTEIMGSNVLPFSIAPETIAA